MYKYFFITFESGGTTAVTRTKVIGKHSKVEMLDTESGAFIPVDRLGSHTAVEITHRPLH